MTPLPRRTECHRAPAFPPTGDMAGCQVGCVSPNSKKFPGDQHGHSRGQREGHAEPE